MEATFDIDAESRRLDSKKPYLELIDGIEVRKMSPMMRHAQIQAELAMQIALWAKTQRGVAVTEARFWLDINPKTATSLLPDVAFVSAERLAALSDRDRQRPPFAPDLAIEVRSPNDRERNVARKIERYLQCGARLVLDVDPQRARIVAHDGASVREYRAGDVIEHASMPGLRLDVREIFAAGEAAI